MILDHRYIQIYEAVRHGDIRSLLTAFSQGVLVDARDKYNKTLLMIACAHGQTNVVKLLIDRGYAVYTQTHMLIHLNCNRADVNTIDNFMWTPLHHACHAGEVQVQCFLGYKLVSF